MEWAYVAGYFDGEGHVQFRAAPSRPNYVLTSLQWSNTHLVSLDAMREFISCGRISSHTPRGYVNTLHTLTVSRVDDVLRVGEQMLPHLIIKHDKLEAMLAYVRENVSPASDSWGALVAVGVEELTRLYWEEGLKHREIAMKYGCTPGAVTTFFLRHGIQSRPRGPIPAPPVPPPAKVDKLAAVSDDEFRLWYHVQGMNKHQIAKLLGVGWHAIDAAFKARGIEDRPKRTNKGVPKSPQMRERLKATKNKQWEDANFRARQLAMLAEAKAKAKG